MWSDVDPATHFAADYADARARFLAAAQALALPVETHAHPSARGPAGEALAVDVAILGDAAGAVACSLRDLRHARRRGLLRQRPPGRARCATRLVRRRGAAGARVAVAFLHALNPTFGFAHIARTQRGQRRSQSQLPRLLARPGAATPRYLEIARLHRSGMPRPPHARERGPASAKYVAERGIGDVAGGAVARDSRDRPDGLFFAGHEARLEQRRAAGTCCGQACAARRRLTWIDIHTALGPLGHGEKIYAGPERRGHACAHAGLLRRRRHARSTTALSTSAPRHRDAVPRRAGVLSGYGVRGHRARVRHAAADAGDRGAARAAVAVQSSRGTGRRCGRVSCA
ncbi:MAG: M14 family metallopeptidase [Comamonadaceae bacterium]|nr:M14 family metallopeptidase [Comamonadaceae bacterium]